MWYKCRRALRRWLQSTFVKLDLKLQALVHDNTLPYGDINQSTAKLWMVNPLCVFYSFALNRNNRTMGHHWWVSSLSLLPPTKIYWLRGGGGRGGGCPLTARTSSVQKTRSLICRMTPIVVYYSCRYEATYQGELVRLSTNRNARVVVWCGWHV